jgi:hypothetical protein
MEMQKKTASKTKRVKVAAQPTPEQIAWNMPIGVAMDAFYGNATQKDIRIASKMYNALAETVDAAPAGANTRHFLMASVNLARVAVLAHAEHCQREKQLNRE